MIDIVILAQGTQKRMGPSVGRKQLLPLPACGNTPILWRTVRQIWQFSGGWWPTIVAWPEFYDHPDKQAVSWVHGTPMKISPAWVTLDHPGNSSLRGVHRYLEQRDRSGRRYDATIVLLGDVVYSWACLDVLWRYAATYGFVGTRNLSEGGGELWGVAWSAQDHANMMTDLQDALLRHPPFEDEYQPGQMRRWIMGWRRGTLADRIDRMIAMGSYTAVDDYTHDIDLPTDVALLPELSIAAAEDDRRHGHLWVYQGGTDVAGT